MMDSRMKPREEIEGQDQGMGLREKEKVRTDRTQLTTGPR